MSNFIILFKFYFQSPNRAGSPPSDFESEHDDLLNRLATSQQQKWTLEEKVRFYFYYNYCHHSSSSSTTATMKTGTIWPVIWLDFECGF